MIERCRNKEGLLRRKGRLYIEERAITALFVFQSFEWVF